MKMFQALTKLFKKKQPEPVQEVVQESLPKVEEAPVVQPDAPVKVAVGKPQPKAPAAKSVSHKPRKSTKKKSTK